jgi:hypothetical protein
MIVALACTLACPGRAESPYRLGRSKEGWIIGGSAAAAGVAIALSRTPAPLSAREIERLSRESVNVFDRGATYHYSEDISRASDVLVGVVAAAPLALLLDSGVRDDWELCGLMYAETMALALILPAYGKGTVDRIRPFVYDPEAPMAAKTTSDARKSFFSRHASVAFASAAFLSTVYGDYHPGSEARPYVWAASLLAATAVGVARYESGQHFPTDIIAGAVAGCAAGYLIPRLHRVGDGAVSVAPACPGSQAGIALQFRL